MNFDEILWSKNASINADKPERIFIDKQLHYANGNNNSGLYSSNQIEFNTLQSSNSGRINDLANGFVDIPIVIEVAGGNVGTIFNANEPGIENLLSLKNMNVSTINSITVEVGTTTVVEAGINNLPLYSNYIQHTESSLQEEEVNGYNWGYFKDGNDYQYNEDRVGGHGMANNIGAENTGFAKRGSVFHRLTPDRLRLVNEEAIKKC
jgi:hypothetical protein